MSDVPVGVPVGVSRGVAAPKDGRASGDTKSSPTNPKESDSGDTKSSPTNPKESDSDDTKSFLANLKEGNSAAVRATMQKNAEQAQEALMNSGVLEFMDEYQNSLRQWMQESGHAMNPETKALLDAWGVAWKTRHGMTRQFERACKEARASKRVPESLVVNLRRRLKEADLQHDVTDMPLFPWGFGWGAERRSFNSWLQKHHITVTERRDYDACMMVRLDGGPQPPRAEWGALAMRYANDPFGLVTLPLPPQVRGDDPERASVQCFDADELARYLQTHADSAHLPNPAAEVVRAAGYGSMSANFSARQRAALQRWIDARDTLQKCWEEKPGCPLKGLGSEDEAWVREKTRELIMRLMRRFTVADDNVHRSKYRFWKRLRQRVPYLLMRMKGILRALSDKMVYVVVLRNLWCVGLNFALMLRTLAYKHAKRDVAQGLAAASDLQPLTATKMLVGAAGKAYDSPDHQKLQLHLMASARMRLGRMVCDLLYRFGTASASDTKWTKLWDTFNGALFWMGGVVGLVPDWAGPILRHFWAIVNRNYMKTTFAGVAYIAVSFLPTLGVGTFLVGNGMKWIFTMDSANLFNKSMLHAPLLGKLWRLATRQPLLDAEKDTTEASLGEIHAPGSRSRKKNNSAMVNAKTWFGDALSEGTTFSGMLEMLAFEEGLCSLLEVSRATTEASIEAVGPDGKLGTRRTVCQEHMRRYTEVWRAAVGSNAIVDMLYHTWVAVADPDGTTLPRSACLSFHTPTLEGRDEFVSADGQVQKTMRQNMEEAKKIGEDIGQRRFNEMKAKWDTEDKEWEKKFEAETREHKQKLDERAAREKQALDQTWNTAEQQLSALNAIADADRERAAKLKTKNAHTKSVIKETDNFIKGLSAFTKQQHKDAQEQAKNAQELEARLARL